MGTKQASNTGGANCITADMFLELVELLFMDPELVNRAASACEDAGIVSNTPDSDHPHKGTTCDSVKLAKPVSSGKMPVPYIEYIRQHNRWVEDIFNASMGERIRNTPLQQAFSRAVGDGLTQGLHPKVGSRVHMIASEKSTRDMPDNLPAYGEEESADEVFRGKACFFWRAGLMIETDIESLKRCLVDWALVENRHLNSEAAEWAARHSLTGSRKVDLLHAKLEALFDAMDSRSAIAPGAAKKACKKKGVRKFPTPPGARWSDVRIKFTDGETVSITVKAKTGVHLFSEMGLGTNRKRTTKQWQLLRDLAESDDKMIRKPPPVKTQSRGGKPSVHVDVSRGAREKQVERLSRALREFFGIKGEGPFRKPDGDYGWEPLFSVEPESRM